MSKKALKVIVEEENFMRNWRNEPQINIDNITKTEADELYERIDCGLSPENLHCDGEITRAQAQTKYNRYMGAVKQLQKMGFTIPQGCYEIG